ncbi:uncharacterized protein PFLUO_LOCUS3447 [Penicillium psychrofluorescens]|uniref:uncharacterized protein n=1 Tax=Penicillium psychrofluorescens TaxID=3158075 RepID=UPI003CCCCFAA
MESNEKSAETTTTEPEAFVRPDGWMYRSIKIGRWDLGWYASPHIQLGMIAFVCFMCPGMFNALQGLGGAGNTDTQVADQMNMALYSTFAVVGFLAGGVVNRIGIRIALAFGGIGYTIYSISLLVSVHKSVGGFNIFAGALLGVCAGLLWAAQGTIMMSYPPEARKGRYFTWFWSIFNVGACVGALIPLGTNIHVKVAKTVTDGTYIAFIVLMAFGAVLALFICDADKIIRKDGTKVILMKNPSWKSEVIGMWQTVRSEPCVLLLFPMFWSSNWFYTYQQNGLNAAIFNTRTKALNDFLYWFAQIVAALFLGPLLDLKYFRRSVRAKGALAFLLSLTMVIWGGGYAWQKWYTRESTAPYDPVKNPDGFHAWDWSHKGYLGPMFLYFFYGMYDACWQGVVYWMMGSLGNSGRKLANLAGFYKGLQSAGSAVVWNMDRVKTPYMDELASNWGLLAGSILIAAPVFLFKIKDHISIEEDLADVNETAEDVLPPHLLERKRMGETI